MKQRPQPLDVMDQLRLGHDFDWLEVIKGYGRCVRDCMARPIKLEQGAEAEAEMHRQRESGHPFTLGRAPRKTVKKHQCPRCRDWTSTKQPLCSKCQGTMNKSHWYKWGESDD